MHKLDEVDEDVLAQLKEMLPSCTEEQIRRALREHIGPDDAAAALLAGDFD